jgi:5-methylcytosine-specific restriction endonuclease McrA
LFLTYYPLKNELNVNDGSYTDITKNIIGEGDNNTYILTNLRQSPNYTVVIYSKNIYDPNTIQKQQKSLLTDPYIKNRKGVIEYILDNCRNPKFLDIRVFDEATKRIVYNLQTHSSKVQDTSNCPLCSLGNDSNKKRIWKLSEMDADHVTAWSQGGATNIDNCQLLCKTHNKSKGNL